MKTLGKLAIGALLMAGTAIGTTAALTAPADAAVVVGVGVPGPYYYPGYCGYYYYCGYPGYYGYPYVGVGWGWGHPWGWGWGWRGGWGWGHPGWGWRGGFDRDDFRGFHGGGFHGGFHGAGHPSVSRAR